MAFNAVTVSELYLYIKWPCFKYSKYFYLERADSDIFGVLGADL